MVDYHEPAPYYEEDYVAVDGGCEPDYPPPEEETAGCGGYEPPPEETDTYSTEGCEGDTTDTDYGSGGCEGDSGDYDYGEGGCEGDDSYEGEGCEGDSGGDYGSDDCAGEAHAATQRQRQVKRGHGRWPRLRTLPLALMILAVARTASRRRHKAKRTR
jgi:hypothetical protein